LVALAAIFMTFAGIFVEQGFGKALIQGETLTAKHSESAFWAELAMASVMTAGTILVAPIVAAAADAPELAAVLRWLSIGLMIHALTCKPYALLESDFKFKTLAIRRLASTVVAGPVGIAMALAGYGLWSLVGHTL